MAWGLWKRLVTPAWKKEELVLQLLRQADSFAQDLVKRSDGLLSEGSIYVLLYRLERFGYVEYERVPQPQGLARFRYRITGSALERLRGKAPVV